MPVYKPVHTITAVIPVLNEADYLDACIAALRHIPEVLQIIVADGGSTDGTDRIAESAGATVVYCSKKGRGFQIAEGISQAIGDVVLILHADCLIERFCGKRIIKTLNRDAAVAGGAIAMRFDFQSFSLGLIARLNNLRAAFPGISFGDQAQFIRREALHRMGGFPRQMLMEDVELSFRLKRVGKSVLLPIGIIVSVRKWKTQPYWVRFFQVVCLCCRYLLRRRTMKPIGDAREYYFRYYHCRIEDETAPAEGRNRRHGT